MSARVACPHCDKPVDMEDSDRYPDHVSYWGEDEAQPTDCSSCGATIYLQEHVSRWWTSGRTPEEAAR